MTLTLSWSHPPARADRRAGASRRGPALPIQRRAMLTISIIFALLVLLWGRVGAAHLDR
jgi:hypothetical protein